MSNTSLALKKTLYTGKLRLTEGPTPQSMHFQDDPSSYMHLQGYLDIIYEFSKVPQLYLWMYNNTSQASMTNASAYLTVQCQLLR